MKLRYVSASYFRNFIFGVEDSLVSTAGLLSGIAIAGVSRETIILSAIVLIFVEAFSMAAGSFLSEHSAEDYLQHAEAPLGRSLTAGVIMFGSYFVSGIIPLFPYGIFDPPTALVVSILVSCVSLFVLGVIGGRVSDVSPLRSGVRMFVVGGAAIGIGVLVGTLFHAF